MTFIFVFKLKKLFCGKRKNEEIKRKIKKKNYFGQSQNISIFICYTFGFIARSERERDQKRKEGKITQHGFSSLSTMVGK